MKTRHPLLFIIAGSLLFALTSCGNDSKSSRSNSPGSCSEIDCLTSANWKIILQGRAFPDKSRVAINGTTIINECVSKQKFSIQRLSEPQSIFLESYFIPKRGELKIDVIDLGDCDSESIFISDDKVDFNVIKGATTTEIEISL